MITVDGLTKAYGATPVLGPVSEVLAERGITSIIGPNGAGKSTLLTIAGRLAEPDAGTVRVLGAGGELDVHRARSGDVARSLAVLRQENHFTARLTVRELVTLGRFPHSRGRPGPADVAAVEEALGFLELHELRERFLDELSGGQRQRAYVAMVLAQGTRHLLLDEPLNNLDIRHAVRMMRLLRRVADELERAVALVVHDVNFAAAWSDRVLAVREGRVVACGTPAEVVRADVLEEVFQTPVRVHVLDGVPTAVYFR